MFDSRRGDFTLFLTPSVKAGIGNILLAADIRRERTRFGLLRAKTNSLLSKSCLFHRHYLCSGEWLSYRHYVSEWSRILGQGIPSSLFITKFSLIISSLVFSAESILASKLKCMDIL